MSTIQSATDPDPAAITAICVLAKGTLPEPAAP
jgi:hypothetical protein